MGFLDKAKQAAEQAAAKAKEGVEDVQTKRELGQAYTELGKTAYELIESGEISNPRLDASAGKVRTLLAKVAAGDAASSEAGDGAEAYDASQPPAMPT
jgi:outer membrane murein-binding lipoprotein Lpp